jgi:serine/threonine protein kinase
VIADWYTLLMNYHSNETSFPKYTGGISEKVIGDDVIIDNLARHLDILQELTVIERDGTFFQRHPNVTGILGVDERRGSVYGRYLQVEGAERSRDYFSRENPFANQPQTTQLKIITDICDGLAHFHGFGGSKDPNEIGIVHRDVKPDNILIARNERGDLMALLNDHKSAVKIGSQTHPIGSDGYNSPEVYFTDFPATDRSDIFCLGVSLVELLTRVHSSKITDLGVLEAEADTIINEAYKYQDEEEAQKIEEEVDEDFRDQSRKMWNDKSIVDTLTKTPLDVLRSLAQHGNIPFALIDVLKKATKKHPNDRYENIAEMRQAVVEAYRVQDA